MADQLFNLGEEFTTKHDWRNTDIELGLYNDSADSLADSADVGDISTEPTDGNYTRQTVTITDAEVQKINGNWGWQVTVTFDVTDTTGDIDAGFCVTPFETEETGDTSATDHLIFAKYADSTLTLDGYDEIDATFFLTYN